jgi:hypothetical protein
MIRTIALILVATPALAQAPLPPAPPCLRSFQVRDFKALDNHHMVVTADTRRQYQVTFSDTCPEVSSYSTLVIKTLAPGHLACVARGDRVLVKNYGGPPDRCTIKAVDYYGPQPKDD